MSKEYYLYVNGQRVKVSEQIYKVYWRDYSVATKRGIMKILHFRQFYKHFVFVENPDGGRKKILKNYADVNVCIDMVCGDSKIDFERED